MATVRRDNEGHCIIELGRNNKKVRCIVRLETVYDVREFRLEEKELVGKGTDKVTITHHFDKEYTPVTNPDGSDYPVKKCALKYMSNQYTPCTDRARRELMILVLNSELNLVAKFAADQMSTALETGPEGGYVLCTPEELAEEHTEKDLITIFNNLCKPEEQITGRFKAGKAKLAEFIYELAKQTDLKPVAPAKDVTPRGDGVIAHIRKVIAENVGKTRKEIIEICVAAGYNKATVTTQYGVIHKGERTMSEGTGVVRNGAVSQAKEIIAENYGVIPSKDVIAKCVEAGVNKATAQTQYYQYKKAQENPSAPATEVE